ncbi:MAG: hypothetical protein WCJ35_23065 [Planctomycetota bacterium]
MTCFSQAQRGRLSRRGSLTMEWILLLTLLVIGALAGFVALNYSISRQQDALGSSIEGMNFPAKEDPSTVVISSSASTANPVP